MKRTSEDSVPRLVVALSVLTEPATSGDPGAAGSVVYSRSASVVFRRVGGRYRVVDQSAHESPDQVWRQLESACDRDERCYVVCPGAFDALTLLGFWDRVARGDFVIWAPQDGPAKSAGAVQANRRKRTHPIVFSDGVDVIGYTSDRRGYRWVGTRQFGEPTLNLSQDAATNAREVGHWITSVMQRWMDTGCGSWHDTVGAASWSSYQRRPGPDILVDHSDPRALRLEEAACHGGRACVWTTLPVGDRSDWEQWPSRPAYPDAPGFLPGPLYRLDVRAMYPTLMRDELFPTRLVGVSEGWSVERLRDSLGSGLKIARVRLRTPEAEYPARREGRPVYPTGEFTTTLAEPELREALSQNVVRHVYQVARYEAGRPFKAWAEWILALRRRAKRYGPPNWGAYVKALSVALSGRLAKRAGGWEDRPNHVCRRHWGEWATCDLDGGRWSQWRALAGHVQERAAAGPRVGTQAAAYCFVTAYGRVQMRRYRRIAGVRQTIAQHTDGLTVTRDGYSRLAAAREVRRSEYGRLQFEGTLSSAWFRSPNHYWADGGWTLAGIADGWVMDDDATAVAVGLLNPARSAADPAAHAVRERVQSVRLEDVCRGETVGPDGWVVPPHFGRPDDPGAEVWHGDY